MEYKVDRQQPVGFVTSTLAAELRRGTAGVMTISSVQNAHHSEPVFLGADPEPAPLAGVPLELPYKNWRGEISTRKIQPIRLVFASTDWHPEPQWLLIAWDLEKNAERSFAFKDFNPAPDPAEEIGMVSALKTLRENQRQLDEDGCEVGVSREALDMLLEAYDRGRRTIYFQLDTITELRRARIGDAEKAGAYLCRAEKAEAALAAPVPSSPDLETAVLHFLVETLGGHQVRIIRKGVGSMMGFSVSNRHTLAIRDLLDIIAKAGPLPGWEEREALATKGQDAPGDGHPCTMDAYVAKLFEENTDHFDRAEAIEAWLHGDWNTALSYLPEPGREELKKGGV